MMLRDIQTPHTHIYKVPNPPTPSSHSPALLCLQQTTQLVLFGPHAKLFEACASLIRRQHRASSGIGHRAAGIGAWGLGGLYTRRYVCVYICSLSMYFIFSFVFIRCAIWKRLNNKQQQQQQQQRQRQRQLLLAGGSSAHTQNPTKLYELFIILCFVFFIFSIFCWANYVQQLPLRGSGERRC